jgi:hypothetical protein
MKPALATIFRTVTLGAAFVAGTARAVTSVSGSVHDAQTHAAIAGAEIWIYSQADPLDPVGTRVSDEAGAFL